MFQELWHTLYKHNLVIGARKPTYVSGLKDLLLLPSVVHRLDRLCWQHQPEAASQVETDESANHQVNATRNAGEEDIEREQENKDLKAIAPPPNSESSQGNAYDAAAEVGKRANPLEAVQVEQSEHQTSRTPPPKVLCAGLGGDTGADAEETTTPPSPEPSVLESTESDGKVAPAPEKPAKTDANQIANVFAESATEVSEASRPGGRCRVR